MDCKTARKLISARVDDPLGDGQSEQLDEHITACAGCREELAALERTMAALGAWQGIESHRTYADFRARVESIQGQRARAWRQPVWRLSPRWAAAALVVIAFLGGSAAGIHHGAQSVPHTHVLTADARQASDSLNLDTFGGGLNDAVSADTAASEVTK